MAYLPSLCCRQMGGAIVEDCRSLVDPNTAILSSRLDPKADGCDAVPITCSNTLGGYAPAFRTGGMCSITDVVPTTSFTVSYLNHLATPTGVTATNTGQNRQIQVVWTGTAQYDDKDVIYCHNNVGGALLGVARANAGTMLVDGLTNGVPYTIYLRVSFDGTNFSPNSATSSATPDASLIDFPDVANVWNGDTVNLVPGTLVEIGNNDVRFGITGGRGGTAVTGAVRVPLAIYVSLGILTDVAGVGSLDVGAAVQNTIVDGTLTMRETLRLMGAVFYGRSNIAGNIVTFRDVANTKDRVTATMTGNTRTGITLDGSP